MNVNGTEVIVNGTDDMEEEEIIFYIERFRREYPHEAVTHLTITVNENKTVSLDAVIKPPQFQRIRRITGYLVGTLDRFNNAKRHEVDDRLKHKM